MQSRRQSLIEAITNVAVGYALALKARKSDAIVLCFHGEGATDEGVFWESLNFAALKKLPIIFICENNGFAIYSHQKDRMALPNIPVKAEAFGVVAGSHDGRDCQQVFDITADAVDKVRAGGAPMLLEFETYRWRDHVGPGDDHEFGVRDVAGLEAEMAGDALVRLGQTLAPGKSAELDDKAERALAAALEFAEAGDFPAAEKMMQYVYAE